MKKHLKGQQGQSAIEYLIITFMIGIVCITAFKNLGTTIKEKIEKTEQAISGQLSFTGKFGK